MPFATASRVFVLIALCVVSWLTARAARAAVDEADLLPVDQAFALQVRADGGDRIRLDWDIADGYYLYRHRTKVVTSDASRIGALELPAGEAHEDEFFGRVETYRDTLTGRVAVQSAAGGTVALKVTYQGCADLGVCYPPQTRMLRVALPAQAGDVATAPAPALPVAGAGDAGFASLGRRLGAPLAPPLAGATGSSDALPLPAEQAFGFEAIASDGNTLLLRFTPARGYYLYRDKTRLTLAADDRDVALGAPRWPTGVQHRDEHFGEVVVYFDQVDVPLPLRRTRAEALKITLTANFQGCQADGICYPPMTRRVQVSLPAGMVDAAGIPARPTAVVGAALVGATSAAIAEPALPRLAGSPNGVVAEAAPTRAASDSVPASAVPTGGATTSSAPASAADSTDLAEDSRLAASLTGPGRWLALLGFFGAGLLLAFTPCVLPMVPILSGLIAGHGARLGTRRALWLSLVYVLANALVFTVAGVIAALLGANLQAAFQTPWVLVLFAGLFVALALSSFGLYEIQLPAALRSKLGSASDKQRGGSLAGVAAMGALSALIVGPCVAPPLAAAVLYISQSHDPLFGGLALFVLAMGMGVPLLAFGAAAGRGMPTSGPWMTAVQRVFGFVFLGLAVWMLSRIVPGAVTLALFGALALAAAAWAMDGTRSAHGALRWSARFAALLLAVVGTAQLFGALAGGSDPLRPLAGLGGAAGASPSRELPLRIIKSTADLDREVAAAQAAGTLLMFDFYADWCVSCKEMEKYTFTDPAVHAALAGAVLLKADVTANDAVDQALMARFGIIGPPATLFFANGAERRALRLIGFEKADAFVARIQRAAPAQ
ncbi:MAG: protein-disulfide reductase DsbD [Luteimonas sp.]